MNNAKTNGHVQGRTLGTTSESEGGERANGAEHVGRDHRCNLSALYIWPEELEPCSTRYDNLLCPGAREVTRNSMRNSSWGLEGEVVQVHSESDA